MSDTFLRLFLAPFLLVMMSVPLQAEEIHATQPLPSNINRILKDKGYPPFVRECFAAAIAKLTKRAVTKEALLKKETIKVEEVDDRWYSPSKYVWFSALMETPEGVEKVTVLMQKPLQGACF